MTTKPLVVKLAATGGFVVVWLVVQRIWPPGIILMAPAIALGYLGWRVYLSRRSAGRE